MWGRMNGFAHSFNAQWERRTPTGENGSTLGEEWIFGGTQNAAEIGDSTNGENFKNKI